MILVESSQVLSSKSTHKYPIPNTKSCSFKEVSNHICGGMPFILALGLYPTRYGNIWLPFLHNYSFVLAVFPLFVNVASIFSACSIIVTHHRPTRGNRFLMHEWIKVSRSLNSSLHAPFVSLIKREFPLHQTTDSLSWIHRSFLFQPIL